MITLGEMQIAFLNDGTTHVDAGGVFGLVPRALYKHFVMPDEDNLVPMPMTCLLVRAHGKVIVIETGLGNKLDDKARANLRLVVREGEGLLNSLARHGVQPEDVDLVINTHLHADHCAGNTLIKLDTGEIVPTFPNAEYVVQRREYEDAMKPNERTRATYFPVNYQPLVESGQMRLLDGDTEIARGIHGIVARGHTPAMMMVRLESNGEQALFVSDLASYSIHFERLGWMTAYDVEPLYTLEAKRLWQRWALETGALLIFPHDPTMVAGRYRIVDGKARVVPEIVAYD
ncbi:MAG: MBL fold metallo-hydrolase [Anaerolineae bacterium]|nr:MBL fold metallo-hydrolase [Anaerolineae bacterium]